MRDIAIHGPISKSLFHVIPTRVVISWVSFVADSMARTTLMAFSSQLCIFQKLRLHEVVIDSTDHLVPERIFKHSLEVAWVSQFPVG